MRPIRVFFCILSGALLTTAPVVGWAQPTTGAVGAEQARRIDSLLASWNRPGSPGAAVLVLRHGRVLHQGGYGAADVATGRRITPTTPFLLASVSKPFTALAVLLLVQRGRLRCTDTLARFFPEFPAWARRITVDQLLRHTSGLPDYEDLFAEQKLIDTNWPRSSQLPPSAFEPTSKDALRMLARQSALLFEPGTRFQYSNSGYVVLAQLVERVSGQSFAAFMRAAIFRPLRMSHSQVYDETRPAVPGRAHSYTCPPTAACAEIDYTPINLIYGEDNVISSARDLAKWDNGLARLLAPAGWREALAPTRLTDGTTVAYGCGWVLGRYRGQPYVAHSGAWVGVRTLVLRFPAQELTLIILSNSAQFEVSRTANALADLYLAPELTALPTAAPGRELAAYAGRYRMSDGVWYEVRLAGPALTLSRPGHEAELLRPAGPDEFRLATNAEVHLAFEPAAAGQPARLRWSGQSTGFLPKQLEGVTQP